MLTQLNYLNRRKAFLLQQEAFMSDMDSPRDWTLTTYAKAIGTASKFDTNTQMMVVLSWIWSAHKLPAVTNKALFKHTDAVLPHPTWRILAPVVKQMISTNVPISAYKKQQLLMALRLHKGSYNALCIASGLRCRKQVEEPELVLKTVLSW